MPVKILLPTKVVGKENMPLPERIITVSNHYSILDVPTVAINVPGYRHLIGKKELMESAFFRFLIKRVDAITIDRGNADLSAIRKILKCLKNNDSLSIFPEGTRNKTDENLHEIKAGAAMFALKGDAQIVPIMIYRKPRFFRRNYIYVAPPLSLSDCIEERVDADAIERGSKKVEESMRASAEFLKDYVENKRWKEIKKAKKLAKKQAKIEAKANKK